MTNTVKIKINVRAPTKEQVLKFDLNRKPIDLTLLRGNLKDKDVILCDDQMNMLLLIC